MTDEEQDHLTLKAATHEALCDLAERARDWRMTARCYMAAVNVRREIDEALGIEPEYFV
jgi:hypothetical protein